VRGEAGREVSPAAASRAGAAQRRHAAAPHRAVAPRRPPRATVEPPLRHPAPREHCVEDKVSRPITGGAQRSSPRIEWWCVELGRRPAPSRHCSGRAREEEEEEEEEEEDRPRARPLAGMRRRTQPPADPPALAGSTCTATPPVKGLDSRPPERRREEGKGQRLCSASGLLFSGRRSRGGPHCRGAPAGGSSAGWRRGGGSSAPLKPPPAPPISLM
jgi:hypothetical protein